MHVAFVSHSSDLHGAERCLLDLLIGLREHDVYPLVILPRNGALVEELEKNHINYLIHPYFWWIGKRFRIIKGIYNFLLNHLLIQRLARKLQSVPIDRVYSNTSVISAGAMLAKKIGVKHIWHIHESVQEGLGLKFSFGTNYAKKFITNNSDYIIYNSSALKTKFDPLITNTPSSVIYNGWLINEHTNMRKILNTRKTIKLCIIGSVCRSKGQHEAIKALSILSLEFTDILLNIVGEIGDNAYFEELKTLCSELNVSSNIAWLGFSNNVSKVLKQSDITLVCTQFEAFGRVVVEAMAEGCPVIGSRSGGIPEIITEDENGLMYENGNPEDLARQITRLINNTTLYSKLSETALLEVYGRFSRKRYAKEIYQVLERVN